MRRPVISIPGRVLLPAAMLVLASAALAAESAWSALAIESDGGASSHRFRVELADTPVKRTRGLMYRTALADNAGMLFDFEEEQEVAMWMKNTRISLDMLFIRDDGRIATIAERTKPYSLETIASGARVRAVLEVPGGTVARLGIRPGDRVVHRIFGNRARDPGRSAPPTGEN